MDADEWQHGYIVLEGGEDETSGSAIVLESPNDSFFPPLQLEYGARDGTNVGDGITNEDGTGDILLSETAVSLGGDGEDRRVREHPDLSLCVASSLSCESESRPLVVCPPRRSPLLVYIGLLYIL